MAHHDIELSYLGGNVKPSVDPIPVRSGDTLSFKVAIPRGAKAEITFPEPKHFSTHAYQDGDDPVIVHSAADTTYDCKLSMDGQELKLNKGARGGSMVLIKGR